MQTLGERGRVQSALYLNELKYISFDSDGIKKVLNHFYQVFLSAFFFLVQSQLDAGRLLQLIDFRINSQQDVFESILIK